MTHEFTITTISNGYLLKVYTPEEAYTTHYEHEWQVWNALSELGLEKMRELNGQPTE